jgi:hypothetical protein
MYYMKSRGQDAPDELDDESDYSSLAPLNRAHLTHEPVRRLPMWAGFAGAVALGTVVVEALRRLLGH